MPAGAGALQEAFTKSNSERNTSITFSKILNTQRVAISLTLGEGTVSFGKKLRASGRKGAGFLEDGGRIFFEVFFFVGCIK